MRAPGDTGRPAEYRVGRVRFVSAIGPIEMITLGVVLYTCLVLLLLLFWSRVRGKSQDDLIRQDLLLHEQVHRVIHNYPRGGTWQEFKRSMDVEAEPQ